jgi:hypothetical protein
VPRRLHRSGKLPQELPSATAAARYIYRGESWRNSKSFQAFFTRHELVKPRCLFLDALALALHGSGKVFVFWVNIRVKPADFGDIRLCRFALPGQARQYRVEGVINVLPSRMTSIQPRCYFVDNVAIRQGVGAAYENSFVFQIFAALVERVETLSPIVAQEAQKT